MRAGSYACMPVEKIVWGTPASEAVKVEVERLGAKRVFVVASGSLSRKTKVIDDLKVGLGDRFVGLFDRCREHSPMDSIFECLVEATAASPDLLLTVGGGSVIDTAKVVQFALSHDLRTFDELASHANKPSTRRSRLRQVIVPTTLSGSEWTNTAGSLDTKQKLKVGFIAPDLCGQVIVLDPVVTIHTPEGLWLSTAVRSIDHAIEGYCAAGDNPYIRANTTYALKMFFSALPRSKSNPSDFDARLEAQQAVWLATAGLARVPMGASHGIGYLLGSVGGASHGHTSCVLLPAVLRWNEPVNKNLQKELAAAMGDPNGNASQLLAGFLAKLGVPRTLKDIGITDAMIPQIVEYALKSTIVAANPRPIKTEQDVREILTLASSADARE